jgi:predicted transposase YbfD/YdcC
VSDKSNEITAVPLWLKVLNLKGAIVTLDAMGTQTQIAAQIKQGGGEYVLALKDNQGREAQPASAGVVPAGSSPELTGN